MKKLLLLILLALPGIGFAQITEVKDSSVKVGKLKDIECNQTGDNFYFTYKDYTYDYITESKTFAVAGADLETLFTKLNEAFSLPGKEKMILNLPNNTLQIGTVKMMGVVGIVIYNNDKQTGSISYTRTLTKKQVAQLFGRA